MKKRLLYLVASAMMSTGAYAQWTYPVPEKSAITYGDTVYLYNVEAQGFIVGANDWGTRASIEKEGYKFVLEQTEDGYVTAKNFCVSKNEMRYMFSEGIGAIYMDYNNNANSSINWLFEPQADGSYYMFCPAIAEGYPFGIDLTEGSNRLFLNQAEEMAPTDMQNSWYIVSQTAYANYFAAYEVYKLANELKALIDEAMGYGLDVSDASAVYGNTGSRIEELSAAKQAVYADINEYKENAASPENPQNLTDTFIPDADFEQNGGSGVWERTHSAQNYQTNGTPGKMGDNSYFLEAWNGTAFTGKQFVKISDLPNGVYEFSLSVATNGGNGCYVYAGEDSVEVTSGSNMTPYTVYTYVEDGNLEVGLNMPQAVQNWVGIDDAKLMYLGNSVASYRYWLSKAVESSKDYNSDDVLVSNDALAAYNAVVAGVESLQSKEEVMAYISTFNDAVKVIEENASAYSKLAALVDEAGKLSEAGYEGDEASELYDYETVMNFSDVKADRSLSTEQVLAECEKISGMIDLVKANCLVPGMECTNLLTNPNFDTRITGWTNDKNYAEAAWGGLSSNPCVERWNENFNFYQTVVNVPNGVYTLKAQAFYRPTGDTPGSYQDYIADPDNNDNILAFIYVNGTQQPVKNIGAHTYSENLENDCSSSTDAEGNPVYIPNGMNSASAAFAKGDYENEVMGVVTDGVLTVGIRSTTGTTTGRWTLWDNFRLFYSGKDYDAIVTAISGHADEVENALNEYMGQGVKNALAQAWDDAQEVADADEAFEALSALEKAIADANVGIDAYVALAEAGADLDNAIDMYGDLASKSAADVALDLSKEISESYDKEMYSSSEALDKVKEIESAIMAIKMPANIGDASDSNPIDLTHLITSPGYEDSEGVATLKGWTNSGSYAMQNQTNSDFAKVGNVYAERWHVSGTLELSQVVDASLPAGLYMVTADVFSSCADAVIYANDVEVSVPTTSDALVPATYTILVNIAEGESVKIGIKATETGNTWLCVDNWTLNYLGADSELAIEGTSSENASASAYYSVSGVRSANGIKGVNIVKMSDGSVVKIIR